jgi:hypothetical protein
MPRQRLQCSRLIALITSRFASGIHIPEHSPFKMTCYKEGKH